MDSSHFSQHNYKYIYIFLGLLQRIILGCFRSHFFQDTEVTKPTLMLYYVCIISEALPCSHQDNDQSHVTQDSPGIHTHFYCEHLTSLYHTDVMCCGQETRRCTCKCPQQKVALLTWVRTTRSHFLILITKQTKWKTAFKTSL